MSILDRVDILAQRLSSPEPRDDQIFRAIMADFELVTSASDFAVKYGMSRSTISRWKSGETVPHPALRPRIYQWMPGIQTWMLASSSGCGAGICIWMLFARRWGIQTWMPHGYDATSQAEGHDTVVA